MSYKISFLDFQTTVSTYGEVGNIKISGGVGSKIKIDYNIGNLSDKVDSDMKFRLYFYAGFNYFIEGNNNRTIDNQTFNLKLKEYISNSDIGVVLGYKKLI